MPLLRRGSRGKGAAFPIQSVRPAVLRSTKQGQSLRLQIAALQILGLKQVCISGGFASQPGRHALYHAAGPSFGSRL